MKKLLFVTLILLFVSMSYAQFVGLNLFFGNLHSHTSYSDGQKTPEFAYNFAKNVPKMDFLAVTDHAHYFEQTLSDGRDKFEAMKEAAHVNSSDNFLAIAGFEWTATGWGHINVYEAPDWTDRNESPDLDSFYSWIESRKVLAQFNHPMSMFGIFDDFKYYPKADEYINLVEIGNGNWSLGDTISPEMFNAVRLAFANGWHLGTTVGQDNHKANWGAANDSRTAVYSPSLKLDDILDSLMKRRTYGTEDSNVVVEFSGNGEPLGSIIYDASSLKLVLKIKETDDDPIAKVVIYSKYGIYKSFDVNATVFEYSEEIPIESSYEYFFAYILEADGQEIVTTPVWVQSSLKCYLYNPSVHPGNVKPGEKVVTKFVVANLNDTSKEFVVYLKNPEGKVLANKKFSLGALSAETAVLEFTPESEKDSTIIFCIDNEVNYKLELTVRSSASLNILLDKTHDNYSMNAREILKASINTAGHKIVEAERMLKPNDLSNKDVFILPLPGTKGFFEKLKILMPLHLNMIKNYVENGGTLIILGNGAPISQAIIDSYNNLLKALDQPIIFGNVIADDVEEISGITFDGYRELVGAGTHFEGNYGNGKVLVFAGDPFTDRVISANVELLNELFGVNEIVEPESENKIPVVLIDTAHGNDYSRDKLNDFSAAIDSWGYLSKFLYEPLSDEILKSVKLLVLMDGAGYTKDEYEAVTTFLKNGGRLLLTGKSDFRDGSHPQVMNRFLELIGSSIRLNDDQIVDPTDNYGASYKVEIKTFPKSELKFIPEKKVDVYSGCSLLVNEGSGVEIFATGDEDTKSVDADGRGDAFPVEKVIFAAGEKIGKSRIAVLGKAIFSDYDFKYPGNDNYKFTKMIIDWLMK
ncbi:CehA/McbA family metallohydrolase [Kosmotoga pacifica]|uniref:CehA/McbA family metallohydrolase n=1 Tax=Kosmotoga pacifica TaxID=1330330 RepID=UPI00069B8866|nr:CehA/McbA family metallohydrolase [Kosmotoga pacifica]